MSGDATPPRAFEALLARALPPGLVRDSIIGDLHEAHAERVVRLGRIRADAWYARTALALAARYLVERLVHPGHHRGNAAAAGRGKTARGPGHAPRVRSARSSPLLDVVRDIRITARSLLRAPAFTAVAVVTLALGIGINTAIFSLAEAFFLAPLPYPGSDRLVLLWETDVDSREASTVAPGNYFAWKREARSFARMAAYNIAFVTLAGDGRAERLVGSVVRPGFFDVLGVAPALGTTFSPAHVREGEHRVVLLSHGLWRRRYGTDPGIVGRTIDVDGEAHTVLGVMPAGYRHPDPSVGYQEPELWQPLVLEGLEENREFHYLRVMARLRPGATVDGARSEMDALASRAAAAFPGTNAGVDFLVRPLDDELLGATRPILAILLATGIIVLLIVCANTSNLVLARSERRARELAVRASLGAGRRRLFRAVLLETGLVATAGAGLGIAATWGALDVIRWIQSRYFTSIVRPELDVGVVAFTVVVAAAAAAVAGLAPAFRASRPDLRSALAETTAVAGGGGDSRRLRDVLVSGQIALTVTLLVTAGLLTRSLAELTSVPSGFETEGRLVFDISLTGESYPDRESVVGFYRHLVDELGALPGVRRAALVSDLPFTEWNVWNDYLVPGASVDPDEAHRAEIRSVDPEYFPAMGIPLLAGENLPREVGPGDPSVAVVNRRMAREAWPGERPIGKTFRVGSLGAPVSEWEEHRVVGVVANVLDDGFDGEVEALFYRPFRQRPRRGMTVVLETDVPPAGLVPRAREVVAAIDPGVPVTDARPLHDVVAESVARPRAASVVSLAIAGLALLLAAVGIYGLLSYTVSSRTREIGVRTALGARSGDVVGLVVRRVARLVAVGLGLGFLGALAASRFVSGLLFGVPPWDAPAFLAASVVLGATALLAAWIPARRAARVDPMRALRAE